MITGHIYRVHTTLADPPKTKIVLCVGNWFLWFNTEPRQRPAQMPVKAREAPGISKDCYLDCGRINGSRQGSWLPRRTWVPVRTSSSRASLARWRTVQRLSPLCTGAKFLKSCATS